MILHLVSSIVLLAWAGISQHRRVGLVLAFAAGLLLASGFKGS